MISVENIDAANAFNSVILGCQRTGTTLLREILHTGNIFTFEENWIWSYFARERWHAIGEWDSSPNISDRRILWDKNVKSFAQGTFGELFIRDREPRHKYWGIKAPGLNMAKTAPYLAELFETTKFIILTRDPRDTFSSMKKSPQMTGYIPSDFYNSTINSPDLVEIYLRPYEYWARTYTALHEFQCRAPERTHLLKYEDLIENPVESVKSVCDFLEMPLTDELFEPFTRKISNASVISMSREDYLNKNFRTSDSAIGNWENHLSPDDVSALCDSCAEVAKKFGYMIP